MVAMKIYTTMHFDTHFAPVFLHHCHRQIHFHNIVFSRSNGNHCVYRSRFSYSESLNGQQRWNGPPELLSLLISTTGGRTRKMGSSIPKNSWLRVLYYFWRKPCVARSASFFFFFAKSTIFFIGVLRRFFSQLFLRSMILSRIRHADTNGMQLHEVQTKLDIKFLSFVLKWSLWKYIRPCILTPILLPFFFIIAIDKSTSTTSFSAVPTATTVFTVVDLAIASLWTVNKGEMDHQNC